MATSGNTVSHSLTCSSTQSRSLTMSFLENLKRGFLRLSVILLSERSAPTTSQSVSVRIFHTSEDPMNPFAPRIKIFLLAISPHIKQHGGFCARKL